MMPKFYIVLMKGLGMSDFKVIKLFQKSVVKCEKLKILEY